jgi:hypothetical protein
LMFFETELFEYPLTSGMARTVARAR